MRCFPRKSRLFVVSSWTAAAAITIFVPSTVMHSGTIEYKDALDADLISRVLLSW